MLSVRRGEIGAETLRRLGQLDTRGVPVLSVYLDLDPARFPTPAARAAELRALVARARRQAQAVSALLGEVLDADMDRLRRIIEADPALVRGARGLAIFSAAGADLLEVVAMPSAVDPMAIVDSVPWLEPLAAAMGAQGWGVAVVGRRAARLFRGHAGTLVEFAAPVDDVHRRHAQGGWSQARFQRGIEAQVAAHVRRVADLLSRAHARRPFQHLAIVASSELWPMVEAALPADLRERALGVVDADLEHVSAEEVLRAVAPLLERADRDRECGLIARMDEALSTGGRAAAGLDEVLSTLGQHRVEALLVLEGADLVAGRCPRCGRLFASALGACLADGSPLGAVDAGEHATTLAARQSAEVVVVRHETTWLRERGAIAALLRW
jgi:peptide chain release factor subunit 1